MATGGEDTMQQYLLLAKGARGRTLVELISRATAEPSLFAFGELLDVPGVAEMSKSEDLAPHVALLEEFTYGTWPSYKDKAAALPQISPQQVNKLKQLTVVTLAINSKMLSYEQLMECLDIPTVRELEDFIITECFYTHVVTGKLDQKQRSLQVLDVIGRDIRQSQLQDLDEGLEKWLSGCGELMQNIETRIQFSMRAAEAAKKHAAEVESKTEEIKKDLKMEMEVRGADAALMLDEAGDFMDEDLRQVLDRAERREHSSSRFKRRIVR
uniref:PCI domain-containing protein n=1 Tax=Chlamydomonas euryale TaxID=1486919 RepID=A0A7R9VU50_9CHLO|mmetsp:Transcript_45072/g.134542  ORF Transcript_45072/g.134542 Transcript_45072/m.134542 type:complete len:269 (+) Transcript_45072:264-1070(+)